MTNMQAKGRAFRAALEYVEKKYGQDKLGSFYSLYPQFIPVSGYQDLGWYDLAIYLSFSEAIDKYFGFGDASLLVEIGEYSAIHAFDTSHRLFRDISVENALSNAQAVFFPFFYAGTVEIKYLKSKKISLHLNGCPVNPYLSKKITGWLRQSCKYLKTKNVTVRELKPGKCMGYEIEWN
ncbi:MAG: hypothetical protein LLG37_10815 [Spirochaetia bacterium]|nr:hypothetical protein [Spirochaetia bacterium]